MPDLVQVSVQTRFQGLQKCHRRPQPEPEQVGKPSQSLRRHRREARLPGKPRLELSSKAATQPPEFEHE